ncbi:hypothetical protein [Candidatus Thiosymbion oneisti]|uniref:hypothetical protein n=1 Tax=Candidatus Thiosymbion oneisti TaxID=589554 RepID=UPI000B7D41F1|nr:hypothetical protein [Candidatus Thiosymbion oneisti]
MSQTMLAVTFALALLPVKSIAAEGEEPPLIDIMTALQTYSHKADLSLRAKNIELLRFYTHELEEAIDELDAVESYGGFPISQKARTIMKPAYQQFENAVKGGDFQLIETKFEAMVTTCNSCHGATDRGFIVIKRTDANPFMQDFGIH